MKRVNIERLLRASKRGSQWGIRSDQLPAIDRNRLRQSAKAQTAESCDPCAWLRRVRTENQEVKASL